MSELTVVGQKNSTERILVESSCRKETFYTKLRRNEVYNVSTVLRVSRADEAFRLVEENVCIFAVADGLAVERYGV